MQFKTLLSLTAAVCLVQAMSIPASLNERVATTNAASTCNSDACADMVSELATLEPYDQSY